MSEWAKKISSGKLVLDRSHPATKNMVGCFVMNRISGLQNLCANNVGQAIITGNPKLSSKAYGGTRRYGVGIEFDGSSMIEIPLVDNLGVDLNGGKFSFLLVADGDANSWVWGMSQGVGVGYDIGASYMNLEIVGNTWEGGRSDFTTFSGDAPTNAYQLFYQFNGNNVERVGYFNRTRKTTTTYRAHSTHSGSSLYLGGTWGGTANFQGRIYALYLWNASIHESIYLNHLWRNPYCVLKASRSFVFYPSAGGSSFQPAWARNSNSLIQGAGVP